MVLNFCNSDIGGRIVNNSDPRGPAGSLINYKSENKLIQKNHNIKLKHHEYNDIVLGNQAMKDIVNSRYNSLDQKRPSKKKPFIHKQNHH